MIKLLLSLFRKPKETPPVDLPDFEKLYQPYQRKFWKPVVEAGDGTILQSKFSGSDLLQDEEWPKCGNCQKPMQLFVQLNSDELPPEAGNPFGSGVLQMFYCISSDPECESDCDAWGPFSKSTLIRIIHPVLQKANRQSTVENEFPPKKIVGWQERGDYPNWEEGAEHGLQLDSAYDKYLPERFGPEAGDKLLGWPSWVQGIEYPSCPDCGTRMEYIFQIDSEDNLPYMFGDVGCGHITQCAIHRNRVAFAWACC